MGARLSRSPSRRTQKLHVFGLNTHRNVPRTSETYVTRVCVIGERGVGKISLADRFTKNRFGDDETDGGVPPQYRRTSHKVLTLDGNNIEMTVFTNSEKFNYWGSGMNGSGGILVVYSVTDKYSFERLSWWIDKARCSCGDDIPIVLVGNKCDEVSKTVVDFPTAWDFAVERNLPLVEVSAKDGINVELAFMTLLSKIRLEELKVWFSCAVK